MGSGVNDSGLSRFHIMREVEKLCDRIAVLHRGRILAMGSVDDLESEYDEPDMEELFFDLIQRFEDTRQAESATP